MPYSAFIMKRIILFIIFSLLCSFSLVYATPSCEEAWTVKKPGLIIKIFKVKKRIRTVARVANKKTTFLSGTKAPKE